MGDFASPFRQPPPAPSKSNLPTLYYGLVVIATAALLLALYNLLIVRWCTRSHQIQRAPGRRSPLVEISTSQSCVNPNRNLLSSFKYKKGVAADEQGVELNDCECAVCLSAFEEGEEVTRWLAVSSTCREYTASKFSRKCAGLRQLSLMDFVFPVGKGNSDNVSCVVGICGPVGMIITNKEYR
ncbi:RING-H2 finger protein ATL52-like [Juglans microcarpa x Juglans regia]|uniref:RING-H2 finger protein ATL52-like n=1 Tax=Juglans microcarpa x Juglans regia TaxID=2249226 RepID=UPI001B7E3670|nr:RING-H2 finger protein ATL52-like [Juglans microcarpa x Juglans regia]